jgi:CheY-like chemotaxis protein
MALTVLVVDDYADARLLLTYTLQDAGFVVILAENGPDGIAMAREHRPAAIVMDLHLPGMSGVEATRQIRADPALAHLPIVAHTLSSAPLSAEEKSLYDAVFSKPTPPESLTDMLHRVIRAKSDG